MTRWMIAVAAALSLIATSTVAQVVIKLGTFAPAGSIYHDALVELQQEWARISAGTVEIRIYAGGVTGSEGDMLRKMRIGQLQAATITSGGLPDIDPDFKAFQIPMLFQSIEELDYVVGVMRPKLDDMLLKKGFRSLGWADAGWLYFFSRRPVRTPDDLRPQRIFVFSGADRFVEAWRDAGFRPEQVSANDIYTALQSRMLDAISAPPLIALSNQWFAQVPYMNTVKWAPLMASLLVSERTWNSIPEELRPELTAAAERVVIRMRAEVRDYSDEAIAVMQKNGLKVYKVTDAETEIWRREVRTFFDPLIGSYIDAELVGDIERALSVYRAGQ